MRTRVPLITIAAALALALPVSASAATVSLVPLAPPKHGRPGVERGLYTAAPGEANDVELAVEPGRLLVRDAGAAIRPGANCAARPGGWVACTAPRANRRLAVTVKLGDRDDALVLTGRAALRQRVDAGDGNDRVTVWGRVAGFVQGDGGDDVLDGGPLGDVLFGGPGADELHGGGGDDELYGAGYQVTDVPDEPDLIDGGPGRHDRVSYLDFGPPVTVDLAAGRGGADGEDTLTGIEDAEGGTRHSVLLGSDGPNRLTDRSGGGGRIEGRGGDDLLSGGGRGEPLLGGDGNDRILSFGNAAVGCGEGEDLASAYDAHTVVSARDCEQIGTAGAGLANVRANGRGLAFVVRMDYPPEHGLCGVGVVVRGPADRGPVLASRTVRVANGHRRTIRLRAPSALPGTVAVEMHAQLCDPGGTMHASWYEPLAVTQLRLRP